MITSRVTRAQRSGTRNRCECEKQPLKLGGNDAARVASGARGQSETLRRVLEHERGFYGLSWKKSDVAEAA